MDRSIRGRFTPEQLAEAAQFRPVLYNTRGGQRIWPSRLGHYTKLHGNRYYVHRYAVPWTKVEQAAGRKRAGVNIPFDYNEQAVNNRMTNNQLESNFFNVSQTLKSRYNSAQTLSNKMNVIVNAFRNAKEVDSNFQPTSQFLSKLSNYGRYNNASETGYNTNNRLNYALRNEVPPPRMIPGRKNVNWLEKNLYKSLLNAVGYRRMAKNNAARIIQRKFRARRQRKQFQEHLKYKPGGPEYQKIRERWLKNYGHS